MSSLPDFTSMTCKVLSQPATNVRSPATAGEPLTGPCVLKFQTCLPFLSKQYNVSSYDPKRMLSPTKLAPDVISAPVGKAQRFVPVLASTQWNKPLESPT